MNTDKNIKDLLILLEHPLVVAKIREISNSNFQNGQENDAQLNASIGEINRLNLEIEKFIEHSKKDHEELFEQRKYISQLINDNSVLKKINQEIQTDNDNLLATNLKMKNDLKDLMVQVDTKNIQSEELTSIIKAFNEQFSMFYQYKLLDKETLRSLNRIVKQETIENFIACGSQKENLEAIWDFIKIRVINGEMDDLDLLKDIYIYFMKLYNSTSDQIIFRQQNVNIGDDFDVSLHIRTSNGKASGKIACIYLEGYTNAVTNVVVKKSIVRVE